MRVGYEVDERDEPAVKATEREKRHIRFYLRSQGIKERITHLERVATKRLYGVAHDIWDVHTSKDRWWVITEPTNLYSQKDVPSMGMAFTLHLGVYAQLSARSRIEGAGAAEEARFARTFRLGEKAGETLNEADETEDFQAVGMQCRECLLELVREAAADEMVPAGEGAPKTGDFVQWSEHIANAIAGGSSADRVRGYLKTVAKSTWELVNWLTHAKNATRADAQLAMGATFNGA